MSLKKPLKKDTIDPYSAGHVYYGEDHVGTRRRTYSNVNATSPCKHSRIQSILMIVTHIRRLIRQQNQDSRGPIPRRLHTGEAVMVRRSYSIQRKADSG